MDKDAGLVIKVRVSIPQRSVVVLGRASNLKMLLCYDRKPYSVASIVGNPSDIGSPPGNKTEEKTVSLGHV